MTSYDFDDPGVASVFDEVSLWAARFGALLFDNLSLPPNSTILDEGCGTGFPLFELAQRCGAGCRLAGIDVWGAGLARAAQKGAVYRLPNVALIRADGSMQPFRDLAFDLIVSNLGVNNWSDPAAVLAECFRVAKRGATIALTTNVVGHYAEFYAVYREILSERGDADSLARLARNEAHRGTGESVRDLLMHAGFTIVRSVDQRFQYRFVDGTALLNHFLTRAGFLDGWRSAVAERDQETIFALLERRLNERAREQGSLTMTVPALYIEAAKE
jgi:arsenite methyltransferase